MNAEDLLNEFVEKVDGADPHVVIHHGTVVGVLKKACGSDQNYRIVLKTLTGRASSKDLNDAQWYALYHFALPIKPEGEKWQSGHGDNVLERRCNTLLNFGLRQDGQMEMPL